MIRHTLRRRGRWWFVDFEWGNRRRRIALKCTTRAEADQLAPLKMAEVMRLSGPPPVTLGALSIEWLKAARMEKRSWKGDQYLAQNILDHFGFETPLEAIRPIDVQAFKTALASRPCRRGGAISKATINRHLALLRAMFNRAVDLDLFAGANPCRRVGMYSEHRRKQLFSEAEILALWRAAAERQPTERSGIRWYFAPMMAMATLAGMRLGEILSLRWTDVRDGVIVIRAETAKSKRERQVPISPALAKVLKSLPPHAGEYVFPVRRSPDVIAKVWREVKAAAGVNQAMHFHALRHTFVSGLLRLGIDPQTVRDLAGHSDISVTDLYAHTTEERMAEAVEVLGKSLRIRVPKVCQKTPPVLPALKGKKQP